MIFDVVSLISIISEAITLEPGDILVTGTPSGVGMARKPQLVHEAWRHLRGGTGRRRILSNVVCRRRARRATVIIPS